MCPLLLKFAQLQIPWYMYLPIVTVTYAMAMQHRFDIEHNVDLFENAKSNKTACWIVHYNVHSCVMKYWYLDTLKGIRVMTQPEARINSGIFADMLMA